MALRHDNNHLESSGVRLIRGGRLNDIAYVRDVCQITSSVRGVCPCCQNDWRTRGLPSLHESAPPG